ncbi:hypothetical protein [uncultured Hymenobacter sp.]
MLATRLQAAGLARTVATVAEVGYSGPTTFSRHFGYVPTPLNKQANTLL